MFTLHDLPDLTDTTAVVTGANSGLGLFTSRALAGAGATVVMTARSEAKYREAEASILPTNRRARLEFAELDLADLSSVRRAADQITGAHDTIDILVNNAGVMFTPEATTADGLELQLGTNHFGHFAFTGLLLDALVAAGDSRVVTVSSGAHHQGRMDFDDLHQQQSDGYDSWAQYARSKLANLLFMLEFQRRLDAVGLPVRSVGSHPGYTATNLQAAGANLPGAGLGQRLVGMLTNAVGNRLLAMPVEEGGLSEVYAAVGDVPPGSYWGPSGFQEMRGPVGPVAISAAARDEDDAARLWEVSVETTGVTYSALATD